MRKNTTRLESVLEAVRTLAIEYYCITGKPLGVTGEIGEFEAARQLNLKLSGPRESGFDAVHPSDAPGPTRVQIKTRRLPKNPNPGNRIGKIDLTKEWDSVVLVILDEQFLPVEMYEAERAVLEPVLIRPGSIARNVRGQISISQFKKVAEVAWKANESPRTQNNSDGSIRKS